MAQPSPFPTIDAFLDALWLEDGLADNTLAAYRRDLCAFGGWLRAEHGRPPESALREDIQAWLAAQHRQTKASTANRRLAALRRFFLWALRRGLCAEDPCLGLRSARQPARFPKTLSEAQVEALLAAPDIGTTLGLRDRAMLETLYATGLRVSELVGLDVQDLSLSDGVVRTAWSPWAPRRCTGSSATCAKAAPPSWARAPATPCSPPPGGPP